MIREIYLIILYAFEHDSGGSLIWQLQWPEKAKLARNGKGSRFFSPRSCAPALLASCVSQWQSLGHLRLYTYA